MTGVAGRRSDQKPKRSAEGVAALRFASSFETDPQVRGPDRVVGALLSRHLRTIARSRALRAPILRHYRRALPGIYEYHIVRTKYIDEAVAAELADGAQQALILGAGFDTRALRLQNVLKSINVFEVDHPANCRQKQARVQRIGQLPAALSFIAVDFEHDELLPALETGGYRNDLRTVFVWEGVSMFLSTKAVTSILAFVASAAPGSAIIFDYVLRSVVTGCYRDAYGAKEAATYLAREGEPYVFGLERDEVGPLLLRHGLLLESRHDSVDLQERYLRKSNGDLLGRVNAFHGLALARTPGAQVLTTDR